jgi:hypothetical protein
MIKEKALHKVICAMPFFGESIGYRKMMGCWSIASNPSLKI